MVKYTTADKKDGTVTVFKNNKFHDNVPSRKTLNKAKAEADRIAKMVAKTNNNPITNELDTTDLIANFKSFSRQDQANEQKNGRYWKVSEISHSLQDMLDEDEVNTLAESSRNFYETQVIRKIIKEEIFPQQIQATEYEYQTTLDLIEDKLSEAHGGTIPAHLQESLETLRNMEPPTLIALKAYRYLYGEDSDKMNAMSRAQVAIMGEIKNIASLTNTDRKTAAAYYEAYRQQYRQEFAHLPENERPDAPQEWINTKNPTSGFKAPGMLGNYMPSDPASLYASYRLRSDPEAIPSILKNSEELYASIDLEVAGPAGKENLKRRDMFDPEQGRIIEVGIVVYDSKGEIVEKFEKLSRPDADFFKQHGTGAPEIHGITKSMISNSKTWPEIAPQVSEVLDGKIMLAQNAAFEKSWLARHLENFNYTEPPLIVDTMEIAQKHLDLTNNRLSTICKKMKIPYTNGHRAMHDAEVAGEAFFKMKKTIQRKWNSNPNRKNAPKVVGVPLETRWNGWQHPKYRN